MVSGLAKAIGHLGHRLTLPLISGPTNSNNILYNITFSSRKKKKGLQTAITKSHQAMKAHFSQRLVSHRERNKKKKRKKKKITNGHHQIPSNHEGLFLTEKEAEVTM